MTASKSVDEIIETIEHHRLISTNDVAKLRRRWATPTRKDPSNADEFRKWLVVNRYVTEFVSKVVSGRKSDQLVLNEYRLQDQLISGPMAGAYLAIDALDRPVAIEVVSGRSVASRAVLDEFMQSARKAMKVRHPNVGATLDVGEAYGLHYLVKEYYDGQTLEDILERRGKLPYLQATRMFALALAGLDALHKEGVPGGDLTADCLLLAPTAKNTPNQRTVKILHAGVKRQLFDETAIGRSICLVQGIPDELQLAASSTFEVKSGNAFDPAGDIFRIGCVFYRALTGKAPFDERQMAAPTRPAAPISQIAPEVPEMLAEIVEQMIDPDPGKRQRQAAHVAKALRVFLASEEHSKEVKEEEKIVAPSDHPTYKVDEPAAAEQPADEEEVDEGSDEEPVPARRRSAAPVGADVNERIIGLWEDLRPTNRELVFVAGGALVVLLLIAVLSFLTGMRITFFAGLVMGAAASYFVDRYLHWRQSRNETGDTTDAMA